MKDARSAWKMFVISSHSLAESHCLVKAHPVLFKHVQRQQAALILSKSMCLLQKSAALSSAHTVALQEIKCCFGRKLWSLKLC